MLVISKEHITKAPGVCGGKACIAGTRIRVMDIVALDRQGLSPSEIVDQYEEITLADVFAALTYYHDHTEEIEALFAEDRKWDDYGKTQPSKLKEFRDRHVG
jgi:uncharacterized protein (DUF433 family)